MNNLLFSVLRAAIDDGNVPKEQRALSIEDCRYLLTESQKQAIEGVAFEGFRKLATDPDASLDIHKLKLQWIGSAMQLEQRNELTNLRAKELTDFFSNGGYRSCVLKGQGVSLLYPEPKRRHCGDIDLWIEGERDDIVEFIRSKGINIHDIHLVHATADFFKDVPVEIHFRPSWMYNPFLDKKLQSFFISQASEQFAHFDGMVGFAYPTIYFNLVHSMVHINRHIFEEGIGLRQLMDYYFILRHSNSEERSAAYDVLCSVGLRKFVAVVMYILQEVFLLDRILMLCAPDSQLGDRLLNDVICGGNFGRARGYRTGRNRVEKGLLQFIHNTKILLPYANETFWIPIFQLWHYVWRKKHKYL